MFSILYPFKILIKSWIIGRDCDQGESGAAGVRSRYSGVVDKWWIGVEAGIVGKMWLSAGRLQDAP